MTTHHTTESVERPAFLIVKHGVYYRPNGQGYTGVKKEAGRYTEEHARSYSHPNGERGPRDGMSYIHEDDAPEFSAACYEDTKVSVLVAERDALRARLDEAEAVLKPLADMAHVYDPDDGEDVCWSAMAAPQIKHLRAARAFLNGGGNG